MILTTSSLIKSMIQLTHPQQKTVLDRFFLHCNSNVFVQMAREGVLVKAYTDSEVKPTVMMLSYHDILMFDGDCESPNAQKFIATIPCDTLILDLAPPWKQKIIHILGEHVVSIERFKLDTPSFFRPRLEKIKNSLLPGYLLLPIDLEIATEIVKTKSSFAADHVSQFGNAVQFIKYGFGFCVLHNSEIVSIASTFAVSSCGIEIQINTLPGERRKGLASAVAAALILNAVDRGLEPHWDAANHESIKLAQKLGYLNPHACEALVRIKQ